MGEVGPELDRAVREMFEGSLDKVQCRRCKHQTEPGSCRPFDEGVPAEILGGFHDHREPCPGDHGIRFEPTDEADDQP